MSTSMLIRCFATLAALTPALGAQVPAKRAAPVPMTAPVPVIPATPALPVPSPVPVEPVMPSALADLADVEFAFDFDLRSSLKASAMELADARIAAAEAEFALKDLNLDRFSFSVGRSDRWLDARPRQGWAPQDPADSLYRLAREALNRGEYRQAAQLFNEVTKKFPSSRYAMDCAYWEAFSRYRIGTTDELKSALQILDGKGAVAVNPDAMLRQGRSAMSGSIDVPALRARVQGALAARGDREAATALQAEARETNSCDREEVSVRAEALQALAQMDFQSALPVVRKVLQRREECTVELRRRALYLLSRQPDAQAASLVLDAAKNDPDDGIRADAMRVLPRVAGDSAVPQLEELLRSSSDERTQRAAVYALANIDNDRARKAVRTIIERPDAVERVRYEAILGLARDRDGRPPTPDEMSYLRSLYTKLDSPRLREAVLMAIGRVEGPETEQFLLGVAKNDKEPTSVRVAALQRLGRMESVSVPDIAKLYDVAGARTLREQILRALSERKEPEAIDKLIDIARKDTDPQIRRVAITLLARSNNERAKQVLKELIDK